MTRNQSPATHEIGCGIAPFLLNSELRMKIIVLLAGLALASSALADIHDPPSNDYGPTRKLGRASLISFSPQQKSR